LFKEHPGSTTGKFVENYTQKRDVISNSRVEIAILS
jgi:hypothetical protein